MATTIRQLMKDSGVKFGTSGARGLVSALTDQIAYAYTLGFIDHLARVGGRAQGEQVMVIGGDLRPSTARIMGAVGEACRARGYQVVNAGPVPSPAVALYGLQHNCPSVMVTGSHIPDDRNGIKFNRADGEITKQDEQGMLDLALTWPEEAFDAAGMLRTAATPPPPKPEVAQEYVQRWLDFFPSQCLQGSRVAVYQQSTVGRDLLVTILGKLGAEVSALARSERFVPVDTEAIRDEDVRLARDWAKTGEYDAIVSADGDCDRPLLATELGDWIRGDVLGVLCARYLGATAVATPVSCNSVVEKCSAFEQVVRTKIGSPYVIEAMTLLAAAASVVVGYEANGGFLQHTPIEMGGKRLNPLPTRDAVLPVVSVLLAAKTAGCPLSQLLRTLPPRFTASERLEEFPRELTQRKLSRFYSEASGPDLEAFAEEFGELSGLPKSMDVTDGLRVTFQNQEVIHLRPSGNAPELRCYVEAASSERAASLAAACRKRMQRWRNA